MDLKTRTQTALEAISRSDNLERFATTAANCQQLMRDLSEHNPYSYWLGAIVSALGEQRRNLT